MDNDSHRRTKLTQQRRARRAAEYLKPWEKRREERLLKYKKEQDEMAYAKYNSTKHIQPSDVRGLSSKDLIDYWNCMKDSQNALDKDAVFKEIKRRAAKCKGDFGTDDPVEILRVAKVTDCIKRTIRQGQEVWKELSGDNAPTTIDSINQTIISKVNQIAKEEGLLECDNVNDVNVFPIALSVLVPKYFPEENKDGNVQQNN